MAQRGSEMDRRPKMAGRDRSAPSGCQSRMKRDGLAVVGAKRFHRAMVPIMRLAVEMNFRRIRVLHAERMPREGAVLLVANHPSTWTDVVLLDAVLGRRFHFLAQEEQFHPWPRKILLKLYGTLPLWSRERAVDAPVRNADTFHRCEALFDHHEGVAAFPEGISRVDRGLLPLKHGASRLALSYAERHDVPSSFALVPVGIYYSDRTAFRSDVAICVGNAIPSESLCPPGSVTPEEAASRLTERMDGAMRRLVLEGERRSHPEEFARLDRRGRAYERMRAALGVSDAALAPRSPAGQIGGAIALVVGAVPAMAGLAIHAFPALLTHVATQCYASHPSRVAFARIASAFWLLLMTYTAGVLALMALTQLRTVEILALALLSALFGLFAVGYPDRARMEYERLRVAWISRRHGAFVRRTRREREALLAQEERVLK